MAIKALFILFFQTTNIGFCSQAFYELKDLEVLEHEKNFEEFLLHVNDIRPSERGKHWREMYQDMAMALIDNKIKMKDFTSSTFKEIEQIARSSTLNNDEFFQLKRSQFAKKYFSECFRLTSLENESLKKSSSQNICETELGSFWLFSKKDPDMGLDLAVLLESYKSTMPLWPFYEVAIKDSISDFYCKKATVQKAIMNKLYEKTYSSDFNGNYKALINRLLPENCYKEIVAPLKESLSSIESNGLEKEIAINILEAKGELSPDELDLYAVLFLLDGPVVGDKMNIAWKKIEALVDNFPKRQKLIGLIEKLPIIPDKIFKDPTLPRHKAIINLFAKNFPEYLNYYGATCIKYISNSSLAPLNVSSSYQCNQFLKAAQSVRHENQGNSARWISDSVDARYSAIKQ